MIDFVCKQRPLPLGNFWLFVKAVVKCEIRILHEFCHKLTGITF